MKYERDGLFCMRDVLSASELHSLKTAASARFYEVLRAHMVRQATCSQSGERMLDRYAEVAKRDGGRCDSRHGFSEEPFSSLLRPGGGASRLAAALLRVFGEDAEVVAMGQMVAMPMDGWVQLIGDDADADDADDALADAPQEWHTDSHYELLDDPSRAIGAAALPPGHACTVFIPLCDLDETNGPTQYILGSHADESCARLSEEARAARATTILAPAGSAVAFDCALRTSTNA